jgi:hypothetical protein
VTRGRLTLILSLVTAAGLALAPAVAMAGRGQARPGGGGGHVRPSGFHHGGGHVGVFNSGAFHHGPGVFRTFAPHHQHGGRHFGPRPFVRNVVTFGAFAAPLVYAPGLVYGSAYPYDAPSYAPPLAYAPAVSYAPPVSYAPSTAISLAPSTPSVVEFPTGRYELRGDGMATPYTWVWIPAPPSQAPGGGGPPVSSRRPLYRWTDDAGVAHWTDSLDAVPQPYRAEAQQPRLR